MRFFTCPLPHPPPPPVWMWKCQDIPVNFPYWSTKETPRQHNICRCHMSRHQDWKMSVSTLPNTGGKIGRSWVSPTGCVGCNAFFFCFFFFKWEGWGWRLGGSGESLRCCKIWLLCLLLRPFKKKKKKLQENYRKTHFIFFSEYWFVRVALLRQWLQAPARLKWRSIKFSYQRHREETSRHTSTADGGEKRRSRPVNTPALAFFTVRKVLRGKETVVITSPRRHLANIEHIIDLNSR